MKTCFKKVMALFLGIALCAGTAMPLTTAAAERSEEVEKGEFAYAPHTYTDGDLVDIYYYSDSFFSGSALEYNEHLATTSMILAAASIATRQPGVSDSDKSGNLAYLFREFDFLSFDVNEAYTTSTEEPSMGVGIAYKVIGEGKDAYTLLAIIPESADRSRDCAENFSVGKEGLHQGFAAGRDVILDYAKAYVAENKDSFEGTVKVWTVGYSRGAGVANLLAAYLNDNENALGVSVKKENIFAYTFATPSTVPYRDDAEKAALLDNYKNIFNHSSEYDIATLFPFCSRSFTCYGETKLFDVHDAEKKQSMLRFLEKTNKTVYDLYTAQDSSADPDNFTPVTVQIGAENKIELIAAKAEYAIPATQKEFLESRVDFLVSNLIPDRETYVDGGYEYAIGRFASFCFGYPAEQGLLPTDGAAIPAALYYFFFLSDFDPKTEDGTATAALSEAFPLLERYVASFAENETVSKTAWFQYLEEYLASKDCEELKKLLNKSAAASNVSEKDKDKINDKVSKLAEDMTAALLTQAVLSRNPVEEEAQAMIAELTDPKVTGPLTEFLAYLLFGTEQIMGSASDPSNRSISIAATLVCNAERYLYAHSNEVILSWLRTGDSYYGNEDWHIHSTYLAYDKNGHWKACECGYKDGICNHVFNEWSTNPVTRDGKQVLVRSCPCGYEETKSLENSPKLSVFTIVFLSIGVAAVIGGAIASYLILKKRKKTR